MYSHIKHHNEMYSINTDNNNVLNHQFHTRCSYRFRHNFIVMLFCRSLQLENNVQRLDEEDSRKVFIYRLFADVLNKIKLI